MADGDCRLGRLERQCATCRVIFKIQAGRGRARKYCGPKCVPPRAAPSKSCDVLGCERKARSNVAPHCEKHYYRLRRTGRLDASVVVGSWTACQYCEAPTVGKKYCGSGCAARHRRGNPKTKQCVMCGGRFDPRSNHGPDADTCGEFCTLERTRRFTRDYYLRSMKTARGRERVRRAEYRRRARKRDAFVEDVSRDQVMERGKWKCHLCGEKIPPAARWPDPLFGTVDHVLPLAHGGLHSYANCKPAHLSCNCKKGHRPLGQLGLPLAS